MGKWDISFYALQAALYALLTADPRTAGYRIYDDIPPSVVFPFARVATPQGARSVQFCAQDVWAEDVLMTIDIFSEFPNNSECETMMANISQVISQSGASLSVSGWTVILCLIDFFHIVIDATEPTHPVRHGILRYRFHMEPTS
jgi:hypothetical protein